MKMNRKQIIASLIAIFLSVQFLGIATGYRYLELMSIGIVEPALGDPASPMTSVWLLAYLMVITSLIILIIKFKKKLLTAFEGVAIFFASLIVFELLIPIGIPLPYIGIISIGFFLALILTLIHIHKRSYLTQNVALVFAVSGAGAVLGASLGVIPVLIFMFALGIYDFISVFYTKHMVYMAKAITEKPMAFTAAFPTQTKGQEKHVEKIRSKRIESPETEKPGEKKLKQYSKTFQLGGGDLAIPLVFTVSLLRIGILHAISASIGALIALILLFIFLLKRPGIAIPALPPVSAGATLGFLISLLII
ncbi:MAG: presenilin family intramembrane aspartyl protease [archaeon]